MSTITVDGSKLANSCSVDLTLQQQQQHKQSTGLIGSYSFFASLNYN